MAKLSTATPAAQAQAKAIKAAVKATGVQYATMYSNATKQGIRVKLYALRSLTNTQRQALAELGFNLLPVPASAYHRQLLSAVVYCTGAPLPRGSMGTGPSPRPQAPKAKPKAKPAPLPWHCECPHCGSRLRIVKG